MKFTKRHLLILVLSLHFAFLGSIGLDWTGLEVPALRQVITPIFLIFLPGFLILRILKIQRLSITETILYSVGLSLLFIIALGTLINFLYSPLGLHPFSKPLTAITFIVATSIPCVLFWKYRSNEEIQISVDLPLSYLLPLLLLPLLAILGVYFLQYFNDNHLLLLLFLSISITPLIIAIKRLPKNIYPLAIWTVALSLVFYNSLFGHYMRPTDNVFEFYLLQNVLQNGIWDVSNPNNINAMPGVMVTLPIYSLISKLSLVHIYKIIVPFISSFIPVGLYKAFEKRFDCKIAFLSSFFFVSLFPFFTWSSITMKMVSAGIFLMLLTLLITETSMEKRNKIILSIIFSLSLIWSHYGTSYWFMTSTIFAFIILYISYRLKKTERLQGLLSPTFVALYLTMAFSWYMYVTKGSVLETGVTLTYNIINSFATEFLFPSGTWGTHALTSSFPLSLEILKGLYIVAGFFVAIGLISEIYKKREKIDEYLALSFPFFILLVSPYITVASYAGGRSWFVGSFLLAPFCIIGCIEVATILKRLFLKICASSYTNKSGLWTVAVFLTIFLLFNTGFVAEVILKSQPGVSTYLSEPRIEKHGSIKEKEFLDRAYLSIHDISSAQWLEKYRGDKAIGGGWNSRQNIFFSNMTQEGWKIGTKNFYFLTAEAKVRESSYIYLTQFNKETRKIKVVVSGGWFLLNITEFPSINASNKLYTNGGSEIYYR